MTHLHLRLGLPLGGKHRSRSSRNTRHSRQRGLLLLVKRLPCCFYLRRRLMSVYDAVNRLLLRLRADRLGLPLDSDDGGGRSGDAGHGCEGRFLLVVKGLAGGSGAKRRLVDVNYPVDGLGLGVC